jgi:hypothetical protein
MIRTALISITFVAGLTCEIPGVLLLIGAFAIGSQDWLDHIWKP